MSEKGRFEIKSFGNARPFDYVPEAPKPSPELPPITAFFAEAMMIKTAGKTLEEIEAEIIDNDPQWIDEINNAWEILNK